MEAAKVVSTLEFKFKGKVVLKEHNFPDQKRELIAFFLTVSPPEKLKTRYIIHFIIYILRNTHQKAMS